MKVCFVLTYKFMELQEEEQKVARLSMKEIYGIESADEMHLVTEALAVTFFKDGTIFCATGKAVRHASFKC